MKKEIPPVLKNPILIKNPAPKTTLLVSGSLEDVQRSYKKDLEEKKRELAKTLMSRFMELIKYFELDPASSDFFKNLSSCLLQNPITGLQIQEKKKEGPGTKWDYSEQIRLWFEVEALIEEKKCGLKEACNELLKRDHWKEMFKPRRRKNSGNKANSGDQTYLESVAKQYHSARNHPIVKFFANTQEKFPDKNSSERKEIDMIINDLYASTLSGGGC